MNIVVHTQRMQAFVPSQPIGVNTAAWDGDLTDRVIRQRLTQVGVSLLRFPGGSTSDAYNWKTNDIVPGQSGDTDPSSTFDRFMRLVVKPTHARAIVTVNYGSNFAGNGGGAPAEAAAWVAHADKIAPRQVAYWEIGNEVYGNGYYGASWETDLHKSHSPETYGANAVKFIRAMKAVNPSIKVGIVVTAPGNWPDGQGPEIWNKTVLERACAQADFVSVHWYAQNPGEESDTRLLAAPYSHTASSQLRLRTMLTRLRSEVQNFCGPKGKTMPILMTETNSVSSNPGKQTTSIVNALFLVEDYLESLSSGAADVTWWALHNGPWTSGNANKSLYGSLDYGDYGLLTDAQHPETTINQPFPTFRGLELVHRGLDKHARFVDVTGASPLHAYALSKNKKLEIFLINPSRKKTQTVTIQIRGGAAHLSATGSQLGKLAPQIIPVTVHTSRDRITTKVAPYTVELISVS